MSKHDKAIRASSLAMMQSEPFFASILLQMELKPDADTKALSVDGKMIRYNPAFVEATPLRFLKTYMCWLVMHYSLKHNTRRAWRDQQKWDMACDLAVSSILLDDGYALPNTVLTVEKWKNQCAEHIYRELEDDPELAGKLMAMPDWNITEVLDHPDATDQASQQMIEQEVDLAVKQAINAAKRQGNVPGNFKEAFDVSAEHREDWRAVIGDILTEKLCLDYSYLKRNRRYQGDIIMPSLDGEEPPDLFVFVDTSMSMSPKELEYSIGESLSIAVQFGCSLKVLWIDTRVQGIETIDPDEKIKVNVRGRGGTLFSPGFEYLKEKEIDPAAVIYFTDGYSDVFYQGEPEYPVVWVLTNRNTNFNPPHGVVLQNDVRERK